LKKVYQSKKQKNKNKRHARRSLNKNLALKEYKKRKNRELQFLSKEEATHKKEFEDKFRGYIRIKAPEKFTFTENPEEVVSFIQKLKKQFDLKNKVFVVLKDVSEISYDALVVLLSIMVRFKSHNIPFNGDLPMNERAREIVKESKFLKYLYKKFKDEDRYNLGQESSIHTHAFKAVDSVLSSKLIEQASLTIWGEKRRCPGVQRSLIELMLNTNNHADLASKGGKHWWLSVHHDIESQKVGFSFIDFGVGIFTSLEKKDKGNKFYGALSKLKKLVGYERNSDLLKLILNGTLHKTATGKSYHGKGLPGINKVGERNQISNLHFVTNDVYARIDKGDFRTMSEKFSGTFVYFELTKQNHSSNGIS